MVSKRWAIECLGRPPEYSDSARALTHLISVLRYSLACGDDVWKSARSRPDSHQSDGSDVHPLWGVCDMKPFLTAISCIQEALRYAILTGISYKMGVACMHHAWDITP